MCDAGCRKFGASSSQPLIFNGFDFQKFPALFLLCPPLPGLVSPQPHNPRKAQRVAALMAS